jgi:hypothetical protein
MRAFATPFCFLLLLPALSISASAQSDPALEQNDGRHVIQMEERVQSVVFVNGAAPFPAMGSRVVFTSDLFDQTGNRVGRDGADCVIVRTDLSAAPGEQQIFQCSITVQLAGGQITFQGMAQGTENFFAITGGTGAYNKARGEAFAKDIMPLQLAEITITIFP